MSKGFSEGRSSNALRQSTGWQRVLAKWHHRSSHNPRGAVPPPRAMAIHSARADLRAAFDLTTRDGRRDLVWWYLRHGYAEFGLSFDNTDAALAKAVNQPLPDVPQLSVLPITWLMYNLADLSPLGRDRAFRDADGQEALLAWYFTIALERFNLLGFLTVDQAAKLLMPDSSNSDIPRLQQWMWQVDPALQARYPKVDAPDMAVWMARDAQSTFAITAHPLIGMSMEGHAARPVNKVFGVNLFGHFRGRSGLSEDARMAAEALAAADIPHTLVNVDPGHTMPDEERPDETTIDTPYYVNIFCMAPITTAATIVRLGLRPGCQRHNIGLWHWELPEIPDVWRGAYDLVDEIWAPSLYTYNAFCRSSPRPVRHVPIAVTVSPILGLGRDRFRLPRQSFLFGTAFDGLSSLARKAPMATIRAFTSAFPPGEDAVALVVKALRGGVDAAWDELLKAMETDSRIYLIEESLSRAELHELWRSLDCFVSLHRAEGFGRNIAEAMCLGIPVIATAHSGNMDYTHHGAAALVNSILRPVTADEYPFGAGQRWADPDVSHAAAHMRRIMVDGRWRSQLAGVGKKVITDRYTPARVGDDWRGRLRDIDFYAHNPDISHAVVE